MRLFCDLPQIVDNREWISPRCESQKWRSIEYRTKLGEGQLLAAAEEIYPKPAVLSLNLKGWYKVYLGLFNMRSENYIYVKLSNDENYTPVHYSGIGRPKHWIWCATEYAEEVYWKCADLTDQKVILAKPKLNQATVSGLSWIRCEEMSEDEIVRYKESLDKKNKCVQMHFDCDAFFEDREPDKKKHFAELGMLKNTNADFVSLEYSILYDAPEDDGEYIPLLRSDMKMTSGQYDSKKDILKKSLEWAHKNNIRLYATERMSMANFHAPYSSPDFRKNFITENAQFYCKTRDGHTITVCSYAYEAVWDYVIDNMVKMIEIGFDGISMIFHRGLHIAFEQPVIDRFAELYPGLDPRLLPMDDARLKEVWCEFMTGFMRRLRARMDSVFHRHIDLNAITAYSIEMARRVGLDLKTWAKEGLVDSISQGDMEIYEDLTDCMSDNDSTLIDLEKYSSRLEDHRVVKRNSGQMDKNCEYIHEFLELEDAYGVKVYNMLPWVDTYDVDVYREWITKMLESGVRRFISYNTNHITCNLPEFHTVSQIGNDPGVDVTLRKYYRVLSFDHSDISQFNANWRG